MTATLYKHLKAKAPSFSELHQYYNSILQLVKILIGTIANSNPVMEIWPTSFRTYNLLVPNLLNLPNSLFGNKSVKKLVGLATYESSIAAGCNYCAAHTCSFALRRGLDESVITGNTNKKEVAVIIFSRKMSTIPCAITENDLKNLQAHCNAKEIDAISMGIVLTGFLNKFMDVIGIELEQESIDAVYNLLEGTSWETGKHFEGNPKVSDQKKSIKKDTIGTYLKVLRQAPGAVKLEKEWLKDVPKDGKKIDKFLKESTGHDFPLLNKFKRDKLKRVFATVLRDNLSEKNTHIGLKIKVMTGLIFCSVAENKYLEKELLILAKNNNLNINDQFQNSITENSDKHNGQLSLSEKEKTAIQFAKEASQSPAKMDNALIQEVINHLSEQAIIELSTWLSILQALHRLEKLPNE